MRPDFLDRYSRLNSAVHRSPAALKLAVALAVVIATVLVPTSVHWFFIAIGAFLVTIAAISRIPPRFIVRRLLLLEPFVLGIGLLMLLEPEGWRVLSVFVMRSSLCLLTMILLSNTTPFAKTLGVLRRVRCPALMVTTLALMYRYLFVLLDEMQQMKRARLSRTFSPTRKRTWRWMGTMAGQLFVRSSERADRVYAAMCARGWK